jgi:hypothetical protein
MIVLKRQKRKSKLSWKNWKKGKEKRDRKAKSLDFRKACFFIKKHGSELKLGLSIFLRWVKQTGEKLKGQPTTFKTDKKNLPRPTFAVQSGVELI